MTKDADKLSSIHFGKTSNLRLKVWSVRKKLKHSLKGKDILDVETQGNISGKIARKAYRTIDGFMNKFFPGLVKSTPKTVAMQRLRDMIV